MKSFKEFFLIQENLKDVPRKMMGMGNTLDSLPRTEPYGFWTDRSGNFLPLESHLIGARKLLASANDYLKSTGKPPIDYDPGAYMEIYKLLYDNGWIRVISRGAGDRLMYETRPGVEATASQVKFLKACREQYRKAEILHTYHGPMHHDKDDDDDDLSQYTIPRRT